MNTITASAGTTTPSISARRNNLVRRYPLASFFVLTFGLAWLPLIPTALGWFPPILVAFGPSLAAVIVAALATGRAGLRELLSRITRWRVGLGWYAVALLASVPCFLLIVYVNVLWGAPAPTAAQLGAWASLAVLLVGFIINPFGGAWEELGWRGYALPRLQARHSPLIASLILGLLWAAWHLPMFITGLIPWPNALVVIGLTVVFSWLFNHTSGSVLIAFLFHAALDAVGEWYIPLFQGADRVRIYWLMTVVMGVAAAAIMILERDRWLTRMPETPGDLRVEPVGGV
jgi:membrane protease YdiL (CAAX protease family)